MKTVSIMQQEEIRTMTREDVLRVIEIRRERLAGDREALREWQ